MPNLHNKGETMDNQTLDSIASAAEFARMTDAQKKQHLKGLEIRNLEEEVKRLGGNIARQRKHIRELISAGIAVYPDTEVNLKNLLSAQRKAQARIEELRG